MSINHVPSPSQLRRILQAAPLPQRGMLTCDIALHIAWLLEAHPLGKAAYTDLLMAVRCFLGTNVSIHRVAKSYSNFLTHYGNIVSTGIAQRVFSIDPVADIGLMVLDYSCGDALVATGYSPKRTAPIEALHIAQTAAYRVGRQAAGADWYSDDTETRQAALSRAQQAARAEAHWQMKHVQAHVEGGAQ